MPTDLGVQSCLETRRPAENEAATLPWGKRVAVYNNTHSSGQGFDSPSPRHLVIFVALSWGFCGISVSFPRHFATAMGRIGLYSSASAVAAASMVYYAFSTRQQFFTAVVFLSTSKLSVAVSDDALYGFGP
jgi:hypothetical protein